MKINKYGKQYFLYAKGWYKKSDNIWDDLKKLYASNHKLSIDCIENESILNKLTQCAFECIIEESHSRSNTIDRFQNFVYDLLPENNWRFYAASQIVKLNPKEDFSPCFSFR